MAIEKELLDQLLAGRDPKDVFNKDGLVDELKKALSERILNAEIDEHLDGAATAASSGTDLNGMAVQSAVREIKSRLTRFAGEAWNVSEHRISFRDDRVFIGNESIPFGELTKKAHAGRVHLSAAGFYKTPKLH